MPVERSYQTRDVAEWITNNLSINTYCYPPLSFLSPLPEFSSRSDSSSADNVYSPVILSKIIRKTILKTDSDFEVRSRGNPINLRILQCQKSYIYILAKISFLNIVGCSDCTIVAGVVDGSVNVQNCNNVTLITATKSIRISSTSHSSFHLCCNSTPLIINLPNTTGEKWMQENIENISDRTLVTSSKCIGLSFGPYNTFYSNLEEHLTAAKIDTAAQSNLWNCPYVIQQQPSGHHEPNFGSPPRSEYRSSPIFSLQDPKSFTPFSIPFIITEHFDDDGNFGESPSKSTTTNPCELPIAFQFSLKEKKDGVAKFQETINNLPHAKQIDLKNTIEEKFWDWLRDTGNLRQIQDLSRIETSGMF